MSIALARKLAAALDIRSENKIRIINEALTSYVRLTPQAPVTQFTGTLDTSQVISGTFDDARIAESNITQHEAAVDHDALTNFVAEEHIRWDQTGAEDVHSNRIGEGAVTQHEAALDITEAQITDLGDYGELSADETVTGAWEFHNAAGIAIYDAGGTDFMGHSHNGTNAITAFGNAALWDIQMDGATQGVAFTVGGADKFDIRPDIAMVLLRDGWQLRIYDSGDTDFMAHSHNGTDYLMAATNTANVRLTGARLVTPASASGSAGLNLPHGSAPSTPADGDIWTTTAGLFVRINGSTIGPLS